MNGLCIASNLAILLVATVGPPGVYSDGNVGCLFSESLCIEEEWCYDDHAFGKCLPGFGSVVDEDLFQYDLDRGTLHTFEREMRRLFALGYRWSHSYTQCELQAMLYAAREGIDFDNTVCSHLVDQDLEGALMSLESEETVDPDSTAYVRYTPSQNNPHAEFADEVYFPTVLDQLEANPEILDNEIDPSDYGNEQLNFYPEVTKKGWIPAMHRRSDFPTEVQYYPQENDQEIEMSELEKFLPFIDYLSSNNMSPSDIEFVLRPENAQQLEQLVGQFIEETEKEKEEEEMIREQNWAYVKEELFDQLMKGGIGTTFTRKYNTPAQFRNGWELKDDLPPPNQDTDLLEPRVYIDESEPDQESGSGENVHPEIFRELQQKQHQLDPKPPGIFTEGGLVLVPNHDPEEILKNDLGNFLENYDWGFKRRERLDVKKPGPPFDEHTLGTTETVKDFVPVVVKKGPRAAGHPDPLREPQSDHFDVETDYVYIGLKDSIYIWKDGDEIVRKIFKLLGLDTSTFSHIRVDRNEVTFRIEPNKAGLNASDIANKIDHIKDRLKDEYGIEITSAGVGDKVKMPTVLSVKTYPSSVHMHFMIIIFCGILGAILLGVLVLVVIRSQVLSRRKLHNLTQPDTEASKDYQDLCRARMATKGQPTDKPEGVHGRITSLSRESEGSQHSPSSRSSTSSWSEEPSLTNMDISTGHMVLTYMEDHLKNKDRLEQEWVALCAYEAEPCSTAIALKSDNVKKNRYMEVLPYDHARVVLNELANISSSDYINASSITDHDPRNPAYIATQGPLPHTAPDFWQMVWEQGSVVMVMLTRLTENGNAMCHRYWPEEGSEVYHIYEVHLVSEHIWCDDYLVRSFYLKNVKTGETRTVTQFHFLSWSDHGIPTSTKALLEFRRKVNKSYRGRSCPIVVHCSDGAGRTGTYTLIDMVLNRMAKGAKEIDIAATLEHIRDQRAGMVATRQQFEFVLMAVAEEVHAILKALPAQLEKDKKEKEKDEK